MTTSHTRSISSRTSSPPRSGCSLLTFSIKRRCFGKSDRSSRSGLLADPLVGLGGVLTQPLLKGAVNDTVSGACVARCLGKVRRARASGLGRDSACGFGT